MIASLKYFLSGGGKFASIHPVFCFWCSRGWSVPEWHDIHIPHPVIHSHYYHNWDGGKRTESLSSRHTRRSMSHMPLVLQAPQILTCVPTWEDGEQLPESVAPGVEVTLAKIPTGLEVSSLERAVAFRAPSPPPTHPSLLPFLPCPLKAAMVPGPGYHIAGNAWTCILL